MAYQVIARKWRPKNFSQLVGHESIRTTLINSLKNDRLPHALLFSGSRGVGKTSTARILAKILRCTDLHDYTPCENCQNCKEITSGSSLDVVELDGASNNGVDAIRELIETSRFMPSSGSRKVYIIDEVHMLSTSAFNALLKTLEEPPAHVVFIFATTEPHKIPLTILSRCQRFEFGRIRVKETYEHLKEIAKQEGIQFEESALWSIAQAGDGSMRDSQSLLDQAASFSESQLTTKLVSDMLGVAPREQIRALISAILNRDVNAGISLIAQFDRQAFDNKRIVDELLVNLRDMAVLKISPHSDWLDLSDEDQACLTQMSSLVSSEEIQFLFDVALKGAQDIARTHVPRMAFEMLLLKMISAPKVADIGALLRGAQTLAISQDPVTIADSQKQEANFTSPPPLHDDKNSFRKPSPSILNKNPVSSQNAPTSKSHNSRPTPKQISLDGHLEEGWFSLVAEIKRDHPFWAAKLEHLSALELLDGRLKLGAKASHSFLSQQLSTPKTTQALRDLLKTYGIVVSHIEIATVSAHTQTPVKAPKEVQRGQAQKQEAEILEKINQDPLVKKSKALFNGEIQITKENR
ncbi:MAG: DNA polymerase III subunit gamma/tau [Bdellovibrionales bacterium CG10_big_fil_rev_8_21_14_0_10_45_34]|nr:MAG: DNA polymerase III subunit gamma/tau [Bdellovibrionales bacterium CG10_big_fil_rev_8_21_14_0_10_45_34]